jgi:hypothetical protein
MRILSTIAAAILSVCLSTAAFAQGRQDFTLVNRTGYQIDEVHVSPSHDNNWGPDIMGADVLEDGDSVRVTFPQPSRQCEWDMKVVYNDGDVSEWHELNLCSISRVTLYWNRRAGTTRAVTE